MTLNLGKGSEEERKPELWVSGGVKGGGGRMAREPRPRSVVRPATRVARTRIPVRVFCRTRARGIGTSRVWDREVLRHVPVVYDLLPWIRWLDEKSKLTVLV